MRQRDREVGVDGSDMPARPTEARRLGEKLLFVDELEDTLEQVRSSGEPVERIRALERRLSVERRSIHAMEARGELHYEDIAREMGTLDRNG